MNPNNPTDFQSQSDPQKDQVGTSPEMAPISEPSQAPIAPQQSLMQPNLTDTPPMQPTMPAFETVKKPRKKWLIPAIIAGIFVILCAGTALAYNFWYQNPEKVMTDALLNAVKAKDLSYTFNYKRDGKEPGALTMTGAFTGNSLSADVSATFTSSGTNYTVKGSAVFAADKSLYVKVANADELAKPLRTNVPASAQSAFDDFVSKVNNQWVKVTPDQSKDINTSVSSAQTCFQSAVNKVQSDSSYSSEIVTLYKAHPLLKITKHLGSQNGSLGYEVTNNPGEEKAFSDGMRNTKFYKMLHDCDSSISFSSDTSSTAASSTQTMQIWVSRWTHQLTKISASDKADNGDTETVSFAPQFNTHPTIQTPSKSIGVDELTKDFQDLETAIVQASISSETVNTQSTDLFSTQV